MSSQAEFASFSPKSDLVRTLLERGHIYQATDLATMLSSANAAMHRAKRYSSG